MAKLKTFSSADDLGLHLAFHPADEVTFLTAVKTLDSLLQKTFEERQKKVFESREELEVIYWLQKPVLAPPSDAEAYFLALRSLFHSTSSMLPHFTKYEESSR